MASLRRTGLCLAIGATALIGDIDVARAAPFDFLFGGQPYPPRGHRQRRRAAPQPQRAEIPLPVPRPHFPDDLPGKPGVTAAKEAPVPVRPATPDARVPETPAKEATPPGAVPLPPAKPAELETPADIAKPAELDKTPETSKTETSKTETSKPGSPPVAPSGATTSFTPRSPDDDPDCPGRLAARHVGAEKIAIGPQPDARCTVVEPVRLTEMALADGGTVAFPDRPTIACTTADAFSSYVRDLLVPLAKGTFGAPVVAVWTGPGLECRSRDSIFGAKLSAHGQGLAIDIAQLKLADGRLIEVGTPKTDAETGFETAARAGACGYFHTVLGPGSDAYHRTHWHFDLEVRGAKGDSKYCK